MGCHHTWAFYRAPANCNSRSMSSTVLQVIYSIPETAVASCPTCALEVSAHDRRAVTRARSTMDEQHVTYFEPTALSSARCSLRRSVLKLFTREKPAFASETECMLGIQQHSLHQAPSAAATGADPRQELPRNENVALDDVRRQQHFSDQSADSCEKKCPPFSCRAFIFSLAL